MESKKNLVGVVLALVFTVTLGISGAVYAKWGGKTKIESNRITIGAFETEQSKFLKDNNITVSGMEKLETGNKITLAPSSYSRKEFNYLAFNGSNDNGYGAEHFVDVEFTGKQMPLVGLFVQDVSNSLTDGGAGMILSPGFTNDDGTLAALGVINKSYTLYGPYKASGGSFNSNNRAYIQDGTTTASPISIEELKDSAKYRLIVAVTRSGVGGSPFSVTGGTTGEKDWSYAFMVRAILYELDGTIWKIAKELNVNITQNSGNFGGAKVTEDYFNSGSIVLYSPTYYGTTFTVNLPTSGRYRTDVLAKAAFSENAPATAVAGETLNKSDFIITTVDASAASGATVTQTLTYKLESEGTETTVSGATFTLATPGTYTLKYTEGYVRSFTGTHPYTSSTSVTNTFTIEVT